MVEMSMEYVSKETKEKLYKKYGMTPASVKRDIQHMKDWMEKQPHLPSVPDDLKLESFLYNCKNSLETAKSKLENYYIVRETMPEFFVGRDPEEENFSNFLVYLCLPRLTMNNERVIMFHMFGKTANEYLPIETGRTCMMHSELNITTDFNDGIHIIYDCQGVSMEHSAKIPIGSLKSFIFCYMQAYPLRINGIHFLNSTPITMALLNVAKMFLKEKMRNRIHVHTDYNTLIEILGKETIPKEYGGTLPMTMKEIREMNHQRLLKYKEHFKSESTILPDLSKKPGATPELTQGQMFGLEGSFRKIEID